LSFSERPKRSSSSLNGFADCIIFLFGSFNQKGEAHMKGGKCEPHQLLFS
jgi:hypothetical protein